MLGIGYWRALIVAPLVVGAVGVVIERMLLQRLYKLDHLYGLLLTFGLALIIEGLFRNHYGSSGLPYRVPRIAAGRPQSRLHVPAELPRLGRSSLRWWSASPPGSSSSARKLGAYLRAATENPTLVRAFGINVPLHDHADLRLRRGARRALPA